MANVSQPMTADTSQHRQEVIDRQDILRTNQSFCDVTVVVQGKEFNAHKAVLAAASPFFLKLLASGMRESKEQLIRIELEEATPSVMEEVLQYVYTGNVSITEESAHNLITTADYLLLPGLKTLAGNFMKEHVTIENCVFHYYFADMYQCVELREKACEVINSNFSVIMETDEFLSLNMKQVMEWVSSDDITVCAEEEVFKGIVKWVSQNSSDREADFVELFRQVRLTSMSHDYLFDELVKEELIANNKQCLPFMLAAIKEMVSPTDNCVNKSPRKCLKTQPDVIFVCGGKKSLCYFPQQNLWYMLADTIFEQQHNAVVQYKGQVYTVGDREQFITEYYMAATNSWGAVQRDQTLTTCSLIVLKDRLYAVNDFRKIKTYDPDKNSWDELECPPSLRCGTCCVSDGEHLYIAGGRVWTFGMFEEVATTERFDPSENRLEEVADMMIKRSDAFGAAMNGKVYVAGGKQYNSEGRSTYYVGLVINACEMYNPVTDEWQLMPSLGIPRFCASMVCVKGALYVIGGCGENREAELSVEMFDSDSNKWKKKSIIPITPKHQESNNGYYYIACQFASINIGVLNQLRPLGLKIQSFLDGGHSD